MTRFSILCAEAHPALDEVQSPRLVHWDLWDGNVFVDPATAQITGISDFERSLWGDPLMEVNFGALPRSNRIPHCCRATVGRRWRRLSSERGARCTTSTFSSS